MATFGDYIQSVTQDKIVPSVVDGAFNGNVLTARLLKNGKRWDGEALKRPMMYQKNSAQGSYSGFDTLSTNKVETRIISSFDPRQYYQSVVLSNLDLAVNATQSRVLDLLKNLRDEFEVSIVVISHNIAHVFELVDRIIVLRNGVKIGERIKNETDPNEIVSMITGVLAA